MRKFWICKKMIKCKSPTNYIALIRMKNEKQTPKTMVQQEFTLCLLMAYNMRIFLFPEVMPLTVGKL